MQSSVIVPFLHFSPILDKSRCFSTISPIVRGLSVLEDGVDATGAAEAVALALAAASFANAASFCVFAVGASSKDQI